MANPEAYALELVNWQIFVTLTLPDNLLEAGEARHGRVLFAFLRKAADFGGVHFHSLLWCLRSERGEKGGRLHYHALMGGFPPRVQTPDGRSYSPTSIRGRFVLKNTWEQLVHAMARVQLFNDGLPGVGYVLKGGAAYEAGKFSSSADRVTVSTSVQRIIAERLADRRKLL